MFKTFLFLLPLLIAGSSCDPEDCDKPEPPVEQGCCEPSRAEFAVTQVGSLPAPAAELNFYRVNIPGAGGAIRLPTADQVGFGQELIVINVGPAGNTVEVFAPVGSDINGMGAGFRWTVLERSDGVSIRRQNMTAFAAIQGDGKF